MRIFLGLWGDDLESEAIEKLCRDSSLHRAHQPQDRHMTLCYLGERSNYQQEQLVGQLDAHFEHSSHCSILWPAQYISELLPGGSNTNTCWAWQGLLSEDLRQLMLGLSEVSCLRDHMSLSTFIPHVTLAYCAQGRYGALDYAKQVSLTHLVLYASKDFRSGDSEGWNTGEFAEPRYKVVREWPLGEP